MTMDDVPATNLTVAKLKALCVLNDVSATGKKDELVARLLEAGVDRETLGIEVFDDSTATFQSTENGEEVVHDDEEASEPPTEAKDEERSEDEDEPEPAPEPEGEDEADASDEPVMLSLEDDDTLTPPKKGETKASPTPSSAVVAPDDDGEDDEVLEAEILEADLIEDEPVASTPSKAASPASAQATERKTEAATLRDMVRRPQTVAVLMALVILGAGGWYYVNNQLEPFTADSLRYGDRMGYMISGVHDGYDETTSGTLIATGEYVSLITDQLDDPPEYCKVRLVFDGESEASITEGTSAELFTQTSDDRLGAVEIKGGQGLSWLSVESVNDMTLSQFDIFGHKRTAQKCNDFGEGTLGNAQFTLTTWKELRERVTLATEIDGSLTNSGGTYEGTAFTYGVGGLLGGLEEFSPGLSMAVVPVELAEFFGNAYITTDATGTSSGWEWRVTGSEKVGSTNMWKVTATHRDVRDFCLGYANMNLWLDAESPWAARQSVDIAISSSESSQADCAGWQQRGVEAILPEGELELHHSFERTYLSRGVKAIELGKAYDNRPDSNELDPDDDELVDWAVDGLHLPDNSTVRSHPLDLAMNCMSEFRSVASGATTALDGNGYVWRAIDAPNGTSTAWNISWVAGDGSAGWLHFSVAGQDANDLTCEFIGKGTFDDSITHDRDAIPSVLPLEAVEERLMNDQRFPALTGSQALFTSNGFQPETRIGYLVIVPGTGFGFDFGDLFDTTGATTVDVQRQWEEGGLDHRFSLLVDATDGRVIGWTKLTSEA
jgi:hypothetical protein